jgi:hypothetical protein
MDMGPRPRCRRKTLTTYKSAFQTLFHRQRDFSRRRRQNVRPETNGIVSPAAKLAVTASVDPAAASPAACLLAASRTCPRPELVLTVRR